MLEPRRLLTGTDPHAAWVFTDPAAAPTVRLSLNGHALASGGVNRWRGYNLSQAVTPGSLSGAGPGSLNYGVTYFHDYDDADNPSYEDAWHAMPLDGNYEFAIPADAFAPALDAGLFQQDFFLDADFNHDRAVDFDDFLIFAQHHTGTATSGTQSFATGDVNADGLVNFDDQLMVSQRYNTRLAPAPAYAGDVQVSSRPVQPDGTTPLDVTWARMPDADGTGVDADGHVIPAYQIAGYTVYRSAVNYTFNTVVGDVPTPPNVQGEPYQTTFGFTDTTAIDGQKYYYRVRPYFTKPDGSVEHLATGESDWRVAAMKAPTDLTAHALTATSLKLTWADHSARETSYRVYGVDRHGVATLLQTLPANSTAATVSGLTAGRFYTFRLLASNASIDALPVEVTASVGGVTATASNAADGVTVAWAIPDGDPALGGYAVQRRRIDQTTFVTIGGPIDANATSFFDDGRSLVRGQTYVYRVLPYIGSDDGSLGEASVLYPIRPTISYTSTTATITWPTGQTPPANLIVTITDPLTGIATTTTVPLSPPGPTGSGGSGEYRITGLTPGTSYNLEFADAADPTNPATSSDATVKLTTRVWDDELEAYVWNPEGSNVPNHLEDGMTATISPGPIEDPNNPITSDRSFLGRWVGIGEPITVKLTGLPEHVYLNVGAMLDLDGLAGDPNTGEPIPYTTPREDVLAALSFEATVDGEAIDRAPTQTDVHFSLPVGASGDGWVEHSGSTAELTFKVSGALVGWFMHMQVLQVEAGTPTVEATGAVSLVEKGGVAKNFKVQRKNGVALNYDIEVDVTIDPSTPLIASADGSDVALTSSNTTQATPPTTVPTTQGGGGSASVKVTIKKGEAFADVLVSDKDDLTAEGIENIFIKLKADGVESSANVGTIDDDANVQSVTATALPEAGQEGIENAYNGFRFLVRFEIKGENLSNIGSNQYINISTVRWDIDSGLPVQLAADVQLNSDGWKQDVLEPGAQPWAALHPVPASRGGKAYIADHHKLIVPGAGAAMPDANGALVKYGPLEWTTRDMELVFVSKGDPLLSPIFTHKWGFHWTNYNLLVPPNLAVHLNTAWDKGAGQFSNQYGIGGI